MRLISFSMTVGALLSGEKTVTRRIGWKNLRAGDRLMAVEKAQGLKKGEKVKRLGVIEIVSVRREKLHEIEPTDVAREGFGSMRPTEFVQRFMDAHGLVDSSVEVTRIEFRRLVSGLVSIDATAGIERGADGLPVRLHL